MHFSFPWLSTLPATEKWPQCVLALISIKPDDLYWTCERLRVWFYCAGTYTLCPIAPCLPRAQLGSRPHTSGCAGCHWRRRWWGEGPALLWSPWFASAAHTHTQRGEEVNAASSELCMDHLEVYRFERWNGRQFSLLLTNQWFTEPNWTLFMSL